MLGAGVWFVASVALGILSDALLVRANPAWEAIPGEWKLGPTYSSDSMLGLVPFMLAVSLIYRLAWSAGICAVVWAVFRQGRLARADWVLVGVGLGLLSGLQTYMAIMARPEPGLLGAGGRSVVEVVSAVSAALAMGALVERGRIASR